MSMNGRWLIPMPQRKRAPCSADERTRAARRSRRACASRRSGCRSRSCRRRRSEQVGERPEHVTADVGDPQRRVAERLQLGGRGRRSARRRRTAALHSRYRFRSVVSSWVQRATSVTSRQSPRSNPEPESLPERCREEARRQDSWSCSDLTSSCVACTDMNWRCTTVRSSGEMSSSSALRYSDTA